MISVTIANLDSNSTQISELQNNISLEKRPEDALMVQRERNSSLLFFCELWFPTRGKVIILIKLYEFFLPKEALQIPYLHSCSQYADAKGQYTEPCHFSISFLTHFSHFFFPAWLNDEKYISYNVVSIIL